MQLGELVCPMNPILAITTGDGAEVRVEGRGYARRNRPSDSHWRVAATLLLETHDERYAWPRANGTRRCRAACARERRDRA
jgi:hypothetical protein